MKLGERGRKRLRKNTSLTPNCDGERDRGNARMIFMEKWAWTRWEREGRWAMWISKFWCGLRWLVVGWEGFVRNNFGGFLAGGFIRCNCKVCRGLSLFFYVLFFFSVTVMDRVGWELERTRGRWPLRRGDKFLLGGSRRFRGLRVSTFSRTHGTHPDLSTSAFSSNILEDVQNLCTWKYMSFNFFLLLNINKNFYAKRFLRLIYFDRSDPKISKLLSCQEKHSFHYEAKKQRRGKKMIWKKGEELSGPQLPVTLYRLELSWNRLRFFLRLSGV